MTGMKKTKEKTEEEETRLISKEEDEHYMRMALAEAEKAVAEGEVPVGAVLVHKISPSSNKEEEQQQQQFVLARSPREKLSLRKIFEFSLHKRKLSCCA
jgi:hypothetical protein